MDQTQTALLLLGLVIAWLFYSRRKADRERRQGSTDWEAQALARMQRRGSKPDMAFSAGRDAANQVNMAREIHIPMLPASEPEMRDFYLDLLGMTEMRAPNYPAQQDGFWAIIGRRRVYFGIAPNFSSDPNDVPTLAVPNLDAMADRLTAAGHQVVWDTRLSYARRLGVIDPAGNTIALIGG